MQDNKENEVEEKITDIENSEVAEVAKIEEIKEEAKEESVVEENITNKEINLTLKENDFFETASEVKFSSMFLDYFPIKYRNFSKMFVPLKITSLGVTDVDFGFTTLDNVSIKILEFSKFKLIEFRKKEFRIAIDSEDDLFEYEIFKNIKNQKLKYVFEFFTNLFHGANIKFNFSDDKYELNFHNHIEHFKFITLNEFLNQYEKLVTDLRLYKYKNLSSAENSFYELDLLDKCNNLDESSSWVNAKIKCNSDVNVGDTLTINRLHKIKFDNFPYNIEEVITIHPLTKGEIKFRVINLNRKAVKIRLNKVYK
ncbi:hypothetical protein [Fusobacterium canifelinum]|uniref:Uncharacterized protein n=1 Tax=Fusobacterium canifelinum TaxID=285729 RepID=A0A7T9LDA3_9FUSO|nr:hypothetical protein [Fusobacterium canifelinum]QQB73290.1 hypothetical protein I6H56_08165 [Fusobacterium canifelinum]QQS86808.1 hypothetical protein I6I83_07065 [Fusobacterium canifelinum]